MSDFPPGTIEIRSYSDNWGPFVFDMTDAIPSGDTIASFTPKAYAGEVLSTGTLSNYTEITSALIETDPAHSVSGDDLKVYLKWPGTSYINTTATLVFEVTYTLQTGKQRYYFYKVDIQG